jgi:hypothetical protein
VAVVIGWVMVCLTFLVLVPGRQKFAATRMGYRPHRRKLEEKNEKKLVCGNQQPKI